MTNAIHNDTTTKLIRALVALALLALVILLPGGTLLVGAKLLRGGRVKIKNTLESNDSMES